MSEGPRPRRRRRVLLWLLGGALALGAGLVIAFPWIVDRLGGSSPWRAVEEPGALSPRALAFVAELRAELGPAPIVDHHVHLAGLGVGSDCWVNPRMLSPLHPTEHVRFLFYLSAAHLEEGEGDDALYVERLAQLAAANPIPTRSVLLAFDYHYRPDGTRDLERSSFHVPNEWMWEACLRHPELFLPCVSIHPYREDALVELERWIARGVRQLKWLPSAMGIDPASPRCDAFYALLAEHGVRLLVHVGEEQAVEVPEDQELGNPLRLRRALDAGVTVLAAHCASSGLARDFDAEDPGAMAPAFELFLRLMDDPRYEGRLFGEISTVTQINRYRESLEVLLDRTDLHPRLVHGSDWPLPGIDVLYQSGTLARAGFLEAGEVELLEELYEYHPLLYDLALKRLVRSPGTGKRLGVGAFRAPAGWWD